MRQALRAVVVFVLSILVVPCAIVVALVRTRGPVKRSLWVAHPVPTVALKAAAERSLGVHVETLAFQTGRLADRFDHDLSQLRAGPLGVLAPFATFLWAVHRFDRLHFFFDRGLLPLLVPRQFNPVELFLYRLLSKETFFWAYGADVRTRAATLQLGEPNCCSNCPHPGRYCICRDEAGRANVQRINRTATATFSIGDMTIYTPHSNNDLYYWPIDLDDPRFAPCLPDPKSTRPLRVLHAPNHRHFKGTEHIIAAIERLRERGIAIELDLVENLPHAEAIERYRSADVVVDQCLIGFHGYFSLEAMALGKPVLCFLRDPQRDVLAPDECPIVNIRPETIERQLETLVTDRRLAHELGLQGRAYIERYYSVQAFADRLGSAYKRLGVVS